MMLKVEEFVERHGISERGKREMLEILNESLLEISRGIMNERKVEEKSVKEKKYKSKKAEEYAEEHGLSLEDFEMKEISKKDVEIKVREMTKNNKSEIKKEIKNEEKVTNVTNVKREKVICSGINKKGEACKSIGTIQPEGAKKKYCFRHAEDFRSFECDSDSSDEELEEEELEKKKVMKNYFKKKVT